MILGFLKYTYIVDTNKDIIGIDINPELFIIKIIKNAGMIYVNNNINKLQKIFSLVKIFIKFS